MRNATHVKQISKEKNRGTITHPPNMLARWPPQQIPPLSFFGSTMFKTISTSE